MRIRNFAFALLLLLALAVPAQAFDMTGFYVAGKAGASFMTADSISNTTNGAAFDAGKTSEDDTVGAFGVAVGLNHKPLMGCPIRTEIEYMYRSPFTYKTDQAFVTPGVQNSGEGGLTSQTLLFNLFWDITTWNDLTPYVGGGLGAAFHHTESRITASGFGMTASGTKKQDNTDFAWQLGAGVGYNLTKNWKVDLGYRYMDMGEAEWGDKDIAHLTGDIAAHEVLLGIRYEF